MPRDSAGNFSLVAGNPVQSGEVVSSNWANNTLDDVAVALSDSLDRNGRGGMLAPFRFSDGTNLLPGASWVNEPSTGFYRFDGGDLRVAVLTQDVMRWQATGPQVWNTTDLQWEDILTSGGGTQIPVSIGTVEGQTLYWDEATDQLWKSTNLLTVDVVNSKVAIGLATGLEADFTVFQSSSLRAWTAGETTVQLIERSGDVVLTIVGGNINQSIINFGDTDLEKAGQVVYDHLDLEMFFLVEDTLAMTLDASGNIIPAALVDGRDIDADGTVLDSNTTKIDTNATDIGTNTTAIGTVTGDLAAHEADVANPHVVTAAQAGAADVTGFVSMESLTQAAYDGITPNANTLYFIVG